MSPLLLLALLFALLSVILFIKLQNAKKMQGQNQSDNADEALHMVVHELRAPITAIKDASSLILSNKANLDPKAQNDMLQLIEKQSTLLLDQVGTILDAGKLKKGKFVIVKQPSDLKALIEERVKVFLPQAQEQHITLLAKIPDDAKLKNILLDKDHIAQVINNLVSNSLKFTPENGSVTVASSFSPPGFVTVSVSDTGVGIPKEKQADLFSKYSPTQSPTKNFSDHNKMDPSHETSGSGSGLGLYIVKGIIEAHGGSVWVESQVGKGTTISFTLPLSQN